jgi:signal transduction histidine kinase
MFKKLKIRQKFLISGILAFISLIFLGFLSYDINKSNNNSLTSLFEDSSQVQDFQLLYINTLFFVREKSLMMRLYPSKSILAKNLQNEIDKRILILDKKSHDLSPEIDVLWKNYKNNVILMHKIFYNSPQAKLNVQAIKHENEIFFALLKVVEDYQKALFAQSEHTFLESRNLNSTSSHYILIGFFLIGFLSSIFNASILIKTVKNIERVGEGLNNFFLYLHNSKKITRELHININTHDELGLMAQAINEQVKFIQIALKSDNEFIDEAIILVKELKKGHFGKRLQSTAFSIDLTILKGLMNNMLDNLENAISKEVKERVAQEQMLVQQSKLAAMGTMLGNIAHQWRQPISEISAILMSIETQLYYGKVNYTSFLHHINLCNKITAHMSDTISDFQNFFRSSKEKEHFDVYEECTKAVSIISASFASHNIKIEFRIVEHSTIYGYPREFAHSILNILCNARDVFLERKIIHPKIDFCIKKGKEYTIIHIEDNAGGIQQEDINIVFEPYYTTKYKSQGTGIGLHMTKTMIEKNMNGYINVKNTKNGASFIIKIK